MNRVTMIGRMVSDIELRYTPSGLAMGKVNLAVDRMYSKEKRENCRTESRPTADFPRLILTGKNAEFAAKYLKKGSLVGIEGAVRTGSYDNADGHRVYTTEIACDRIQSLESLKKEGQTAEEAMIPGADDFEIESLPF